jgi:hypothetical protein
MFTEFNKQNNARGYLIEAAQMAHWFREGM